jgi:hypothetical protein
MTPEEWIESQYEYSGERTDFITVRELHNHYLSDGNTIKFKDFKYKMIRIMFNNAFVFDTNIRINGKQRTNIMIKIVPKKCHMCNGSGKMYICEDIYDTCHCIDE